MTTAAHPRRRKRKLQAKSEKRIPKNSPLFHGSNGVEGRYILITGGAGFIGTNLADRLLSSGRSVLIYDNLSRRGSEINLGWLTQKHGSLLRVEIEDVRNFDKVRKAVRNASAVFHFAAQVAVTDSLVDPQKDFEVNVGGTLNVLEAVRALRNRPPLLFTSTNKVYGSMSELPLARNASGYRPIEADLYSHGVNESQPLDFCSPYGCSKGAADQYILDYARTFDLPATVFRMSCIYGPHQFGTEDQGWIAHFLIRAINGEPITIYGDGWQVRDVLYIGDLADAFLLAHRKIAVTSGQAFNIGGGPANLLSLRQLLKLIEKLQGQVSSVYFGDWRQGDQRYYVSDTTKFEKATEWKPKVKVQEGVERLYRWLKEERKEISESYREQHAVIDLPHVPAAILERPHFARTS